MIPYCIAGEIMGYTTTPTISLFIPISIFWQTPHTTYSIFLSPPPIYPSTLYGHSTSYEGVGKAGRWVLEYW